LLHYRRHGFTESNQSVQINDENINSVQLVGLREWTKYDVLLAAFNRVGRSNFTEVTVAQTRESGLLRDAECSLMMLMVVMIFLVIIHSFIHSFIHIGGNDYTTMRSV